VAPSPASRIAAGGAVRLAAASTRSSRFHPATRSTCLVAAAVGELTAYEGVWKGLDAVALSEAASKDMIKRVTEEMRHD
jgi:hypothetical protein